jgi:hypothetical protein
LRTKLEPLIATTEPADWAEVTIRLPSFLEKDDVILATLWKRDEVMERLQQLQNLGRYPSNSKAAKTLQSIIDLYAILPAETRAANPCDRYLTARAVVAEKDPSWSYGE